MISNITGVWLIDSTGLPLISRSYTNTNDYSSDSSVIDSALFSGFITAIVAFSKQIVKDNIETIEMGGHKIHYLSFNQFSVVSTTTKTNHVDSDLHPLMVQIGTKFQLMYHNELNEIVRDTNTFMPFESFIDDLLGKKQLIREKSLNDFEIGLILTEVKFHRITPKEAISQIYESYRKLDKKSQQFIKEAMKDFENFFNEKMGLVREDLLMYKEIVGKMSVLMKSEKFLQSF